MTGTTKRNAYNQKEKLHAHTQTHTHARTHTHTHTNTHTHTHTLVLRGDVTTGDYPTGTGRSELNTLSA